MFNLTKQEKYVLIFISALLLIGLGASHVRKITAKINPAATRQSKNRKQAFPQEIKKININTAGIKDLIELRGVGPKMAERIIDYRETNGQFFYIEDLQNVKGIGPKKFDAIKEWITAQD